MIGKRDVVEIKVFVISIEGRPSAAAALQPENPLAPALDCGLESTVAEILLHAVHCHDHNGGVVQIRIMRVRVMKCPATWARIGATNSPVPGDIKHLELLQPCQPGIRATDRGSGASLEECMACECGVPDR